MAGLKFVQQQQQDSTSALSDKQRAMLEDVAAAFAVSDEQLAKIVARLEAEMFRGLARNTNAELHMEPAVVRPQAAPASGVSLGMAIEATGRRIRIASVRFEAGCVASTTRQVFVAPTAEAHADLFGFAAFCLSEFIQAHGLEQELAPGQKLPLGVAVGQPVDDSQSRVCEAAKEDSVDLCGSDIAHRVRDAVLCSHLPVRVASVTNNAVSALVAAQFHDSTARVAAVFNHGANAAYLEDPVRVERLAGPAGADGADAVAINTEIGRFGAGSDALPLTMWDRRVDRESRCPLARPLEKLVADQYLGEIVRNLVTDFMDHRLLFAGAGDVRPINAAYSFHTGYVAPIIEDSSDELAAVDAVLAAEFGIRSSTADRQIIRALCRVVAERAARLSGAMLAALALKAAAAAASHSGDV
ncbi:hexokinase, partial [Coemansia nantahalensis]